MLRDYSTGFKEDVNVFSGIEIEHTPAYGKQTLFLARNDLTFDQIQSLVVNTKHGRALRKEILFGVLILKSFEARSLKAKIVLIWL